jgi:hypothetical protein
MSDVQVLDMGQTASTTNAVNPDPVAPADKLAGEPEVSEAKEPEKKDDDEDTGKWAQRFAVLSKREKELQRKMQELKAAQENEDYKSFMTAKQSRNPIQALQALGMSFQDAAQFVLNDQKHPEPTVEDQIKELKAQISRQEEERVLREEQEKQDYIQRTIDNHKRDIASYIKTNSDKYELIAANDAQETVFEVIEEYYNKFNKIMSIEEASSKVEDWLTDRARSLFKLKKFQPVHSDEQVQPQAAPQARPQPTEIRPKIGMTLTNSGVTAQPGQGNLGSLSRDESIKRAAAMLRFK